MEYTYQDALRLRDPVNGFPHQRSRDSELKQTDSEVAAEREYFKALGKKHNYYPRCAAVLSGDGQSAREVNGSSNESSDNAITAAQESNQHVRNKNKCYPKSTLTNQL